MGFEREMRDSGEVREVRLQHNGDHWQKSVRRLRPPRSTVGSSGSCDRSFILGRTVEKRGKRYPLSFFTSGRVGLQGLNQLIPC